MEGKGICPSVEQHLSVHRYGTGWKNLAPEWFCQTQRAFEVFTATPYKIGLPCRAGAEDWGGSVQKQLDRYSLQGFFNLCILNCWIHFGTEEDLKVVLLEILRAVSTKSVQLCVSYTGMSMVTVGCLPLGRGTRHPGSPLLPRTSWAIPPPAPIHRKQR